MTKKVFRVKVVTPKGVLSFPHLEEPDAKSEFADNKYKTNLVIDKSEDISKLEKAINDVATRAFGTAKFASPLKDGDDQGGDFLAGKWSITAKTKDAPNIVDASKKAIPLSDAPRFGDLCKLSIVVSPYDKPKKGVNLYLKGVQLLERNNNGSDCGFEVEEGYVKEDQEDDAPEAGDYDDIPF